MKILASVIIPNWNGRNLLEDCLISLDKQGFKISEIILVDNASTDGSAAEIKKDFPQVTLFTNKENAGFSKGQNIASTIAQGKYLFFLNSDTIVMDNNLLAMISYLEKHEHVGILGARLLNPNGSKQLSAGKFYTFVNFIIMLLGGEKLGLLRSSPKRICVVDWVMGASLLIRKKLFEKIGKFDEHFFMYVEDMELCFRVRKSGYQVVFYPDITIFHEERGSSNKSFAILSIYKGILYFYKKHKSYLQYVVVKYLFVIKAFFAVILGIVSGRKNLVITYKQIL